MSLLFVEKVVDVLKLSLPALDGSGTTAFYIGTEFYDDDGIYSGSPKVYPLLVEPLQSVTSVNRAGGIRQEISIGILGKTHFMNYGESFLDLAKRYSFHGAFVEIRAYLVAKDGTTTHSDSVNIRQTLQVTGYRVEKDILHLDMKDTWFEDKEFSKRLTTDIFSGLQEDFDGEYGAIVFGQNVTIDAPFLESTEVSDQYEAHVFLGWTATSHPMKGVDTFYVENQTPGLDPTTWLELGWVSNPQSIWNGYAYASTIDFISMTDASAAIVFSPGSLARLINRAQFGMFIISTPSEGDGELFLSIYEAEYNSEVGQWQAKGSPLRRTECSGGTTSQDIDFFVTFPSLPVSPDVSYMMTIEWSNTDTSNFLLRHDATATSDEFLLKVKSTDGPGWILQSDKSVTLALYAVGDGDDAFQDEAGTAPNRYSYYDLESVDEGGGDIFKGEDVHFSVGIHLKARVDGLEDDGSGTYTSFANGVIEQPASIIHFLLAENELGLGLTSSRVDSSGINTTRVRQDSRDFEMGFVVDYKLTVAELISKIAFQSRSLVYKTRSGKASVKFPLYSDFAGTKDYYISEGRFQGEVEIVSIEDTPREGVFNRFQVNYTVNKLNVPSDPSITRRTEGNSYLEVEYFNKTEGSFIDGRRDALVTASESLYGPIEFVQDFDLYRQSSTAPRQVIEYYIDRYSRKQKRITVRVPRKHFENVLLFDSIYLSHSSLPGRLGTTMDSGFHSDGQPLNIYYNGMPHTASKQGVVRGEVVAVREFGSAAEITIETVDPY